MAHQIDSAYKQTENLRASKAQIKKQYRYVELFFIGVATLFILLFFSNFELNINMLVINPIEAFKNFIPMLEFMIENKTLSLGKGNFNYVLYFVCILPLLLWFFFLTRKMKTNSKFYQVLDRYFYWPIRQMISLSPLNKELVGFRPGWTEHLRKNIFAQVCTKIDGYERSKKLEIFYNIEEMFGEHFEKVVKRFRSESEFYDLLHIIEGYLSDKSKKKYDSLRVGADDITRSEYETFRSYMIREGKDDVLFSFNAFKFFIEDHTKAYEKFVRDVMFTKRISISALMMSMLQAMAQDRHFLKKITEGNSEKIEAYKKDIMEGKMHKNKEIVEKFISLLIVDFKIVAFRMLVNQYMNLPAGTIVAKLDDYSTRMIMEMYTTKAIVEIMPAKNDGTSESFESDNYTNLFLLTYNGYLYYAKERMLQDLSTKFNTADNTKPLTKEQLEAHLKLKKASATFNDFDGEGVDKERELNEIDERMIDKEVSEIQKILKGEAKKIE